MDAVETASSPTAPKRPNVAVRFVRHPAFWAAVSGALLSLGFAPLGWWWVAWIALVPLYVGLVKIGQSGTKRFPIRAFGAGWAFGMAIFLIGMAWMLEIGSVPWFVLSAIETAPIAIQIALFAAFVPLLPAKLRPVAFAALWCVFEWIRSQTVYAFPWFLLSSTQVHALPLLQIVSFTGQWGLTFFIALVNGLLGEVLLIRLTETAPYNPTAETPRPYAKYGWSAIAIFAALWCGGQIALSREDTRDAPDAQNGLPVSIIQGNITKEGQYSDSAQQEIVRIYSDMSTEAVRNDAPALLLWPETVTPTPLLRDPFLFRDVSNLARGLQTPSIIGTVDIESRSLYWNTAVLMTREGAVGGRYNKQQLVPMGEYFLFRETLGGIYEQYGVRSYDFGFGTLPGTLSVQMADVPGAGGQTIPVGTMICYDDVFSKRARNRVLTGAQFLAVLTSDQTFGTSAGPAQHIEQAAVRAVETRRYLVRAAANGKSQFITPAGRVRQELPLFQRGILSGKVGLRTDQTLFVQWGDWWVGVCAALIGLCAAWPLWMKRTAK